MRKAGIVMVVFVLAFTLGIAWSSFNAQPVDAKPTVCVLAVTPFLVCEDHPKCKNGEQMCWECQGRDPAGVPCLCSRVGCM